MSPSIAAANEKSNSYTLPSHLDGDGRRLNEQHAIFRQLFASKLLTTDLPEDFSGTVLDIGTGTGIWAAEFASTYPASTVLGIDLFAPSIAPVPTNCQFRVVNVEDDAGWDINIPDGTYDLIHTRLMVFALRDPRKFVKKCRRVLKAGGFVEFQEREDPYRTDDPSPVAQDTPLIRNSRLRMEAAVKCGLHRNVAGQVPGWMRELGFQGVQVAEYEIPIGTWMEDEEMKVIGARFEECTRWGVLGYSKSVFMKGLGWTEQQVLDNVEEAVQDIGNGKIYMKILVIVGRKI